MRIFANYSSPRKNTKLRKYDIRLRILEALPSFNRDGIILKVSKKKMRFKVAPYSSIKC